MQHGQSKQGTEKDDKSYNEKTKKDHKILLSRKSRISLLPEEI